MFKALVPLMLLLVGLGGCVPTAENKSPKGQSNYMLGLSHLRQQQSTAALKEFLAAVAADPQNADYHNALAQTYQAKEAFAEAEKHYLKAIELSDNAPEFQNNLGALYLDLQRWDDAIRYFRLAADNLLFSSPEVALTGVGVALSQKGEHADAVIAFQEAIRKNIGYPPARLRLGDAYFALGKWPAAIDAYLKTLELAPEYGEAHYRLGLAYLKDQQSERAREAFAEAVRLAPGSEFAANAKEYLELLK